MANRTSFDEVLDAFEHLPDDAQAELVEVIRRRLAERGRQRVITDVRRARKEFAQGKCSPATAEEIMREVES